jgi:uncharacterized caspase-like protein
MSTPRPSTASCLLLSLLFAVSSPTVSQTAAERSPIGRDAEIARIAREMAAEAEAAQAEQARKAKLEEERAARVKAALAAPVKPAVAPALATPAAPAAVAAAAPATAPAAAGERTSLAPASVAAAPAAGGDDAPIAAQPEQRLALVIGNSAYKAGPLTNPVNDARAMAVKLQQLGFTVIKKEDASLEEMMSSVRDFGSQLANGGVGLFYYAGHGVQSRGANYLIPVDSDIRSEDELATRAYNANEVLEKMDTAKNRINMVILDACRDNPFARSFRSGSRGLAGMDQAPSGTLVAYATSPGATASDGVGANGLYTEQLLQEMSVQGAKLEEVFKRVRVSVKERSEGKQLPWEMSSVTGDFYFNPTPEQEAQMAQAMAAARTPGAAVASVTAGPRQRQLMPVLVSRKVIEHYQLNAATPMRGQPRVAAFSPSGEFFTLVHADRAMQAWRTSSGLALADPAPLDQPNLTPAREHLAGLNPDGTVALHQMDSVDKRETLAKLPKGAKAVALSPNGKRVLWYHPDKGLYLYDRDTQAEVAELDSIDGELRHAFSPDGTRLVTWGSLDSNMKLWDAQSGKKIERLSDHWEPVTMLRFTRDGKHFVSTGKQDRVVVWRASDGEALRRFEMGEDKPTAHEAEVLNQGRHVLTYAALNGKLPGAPLKLSVWDVKSGQRLATLLPDGVNLASYRVAQDKNRLFVNGSDRNLYVFDLATLQRTHLVNGVELLDLSADGRRFLARNGDEIRLFDTQLMTVLARLPRQATAFAAAQGNLFATGAADGTLNIWNFEHGEAVGQLKGHLDTVQKVIFSNDNRRLASFGADNMVRLWALPDIKDRQQLVKDQFESTAEYAKRMSSWSSPYSALVALGSYNADSELYTVKLGEVTANVPMDRESARKLVGQRQAMLEANLKFFDPEQLILAEPKLQRLP